jgi:hypothetical protein
MRELIPALLTAQKSASVKPLIKVTFSKTGEDDIVVEEDRILLIPSQEETTDSQTCEIVFDNSDGYFTNLDLKGWDALVELNLEL